MLVLETWESFTPGTRLEAWLFRVLHNPFHSVRGRKLFGAEVGGDGLEHRALVLGDDDPDEACGPAHRRRDPCRIAAR
jgi:hypothetical protein